MILFECVAMEKLAAPWFRRYKHWDFNWKYYNVNGDEISIPLSFRHEIWSMKVSKYNFIHLRMYECEILDARRHFIATGYDFRIKVMILNVFFIIFSKIFSLW